jgi:hypothetical protein
MARPLPSSMEMFVTVVSVRVGSLLITLVVSGGGAAVVVVVTGAGSVDVDVGAKVVVSPETVSDGGS